MHDIYTSRPTYCLEERQSFFTGKTFDNLAIVLCKYAKYQNLDVVNFSLQPILFEISASLRRLPQIAE